MNSLILLLISAFLALSCMNYKPTYPKYASGSKDANSEADPEKPSKEVVEDDVTADPVEPTVKPCMVPESKKGQIF